MNFHIFISNKNLSILLNLWCCEHRGLADWRWGSWSGNWGLCCLLYKKKGIT